MILRKLTKLIADQDWFAVMLEITVLIIGIFLGLQISDWNEERLEQIRAEETLVRISEDLQSDLDNLQRDIVRWKNVLNHAQDAIAHAESGLLVNNSDWETILAYFHASNFQVYTPTLVTYAELQSAGELGLIRNQDIRANLAEYYLSSSGASEAFILRAAPPYRTTIRGLIPAQVTTYYWENCFGVAENTKYPLLERCDAPIDEVEAAILTSGVLQEGSLVVITMGSPLSSPGTTNLLKIHRLVNR